MLLYAVGQKYLVDATAEVTDLIPEVERIILETRRKPIFGEDITQHVKNHKVQVSEGQVQSRFKRHKNFILLFGPSWYLI